MNALARTLTRTTKTESPMPEDPPLTIRVSGPLRSRLNALVDTLEAGPVITLAARKAADHGA